MFHWNVLVIPAAAAELKTLGIASKVSATVVILISFFDLRKKGPCWHCKVL